MKTRVYVNLRIEGTHKWDTCDIEEVSFLRTEHRHIFHIKCWKSVNHDNRDVEFIKFKRDVISWINEEFRGVERCCKFGCMSCEMIAKKLIERFDLDKCAVDEDGENGAEVER